MPVVGLPVNLTLIIVQVDLINFGADSITLKQFNKVVIFYVTITLADLSVTCSKQK